MTPSDNDQMSLFSSGTTDREPSDGITERQNLILEAGAGTGKTTAIVIRVVELLLSDPGLDPREIVLITFTEKAAAEIADRIREAMIAIKQGLDQDDPVLRTASGDSLWAIPDGDIETARRTCRIQLERIDYLESQTIHSFCQKLLRRFPIEARLDPEFEIIHGFDRDRFHDEAFRDWLVEEMEETDNRDDWELLYAHFRYLDRIRSEILRLLQQRDLLLDESLSLGEINDYDLQVRKWIDEARDFDQSMVDLIKHVANRSIVEYLRSVDPPESSSIESWIDYFRPIEDEFQEVNLGQARGAKDLLRLMRGDDSKAQNRKNVPQRKFPK